MDGIELRPQNFIGFLQVIEIGPGKALAGIAGASRVYWAVIVLIAAVAQLQIAKAGKEPAIAGIAGGHHAIKHVDAITNPEHEVFRGANTH